MFQLHGSNHYGGIRLFHILPPTKKKKKKTKLTISHGKSALKCVRGTVSMYLDHYSSRTSEHGAKRASLSVISPTGESERPACPAVWYATRDTLLSQSIQSTESWTEQLGDGAWLGE